MATSPRPAGPPAPARPRLVVSNHDPVFLELLQALLCEEGYRVAVPPELDDPYPFIKAARPALVILDAPFRRETTTLATLDKLRLDPATAATPVVVCTTTPAALDGLVGREAEGLYLLAKPFDLDQLLAIIVTALRAEPPPGDTGGHGGTLGEPRRLGLARSERAAGILGQERARPRASPG